MFCWKAKDVCTFPICRKLVSHFKALAAYHSNDESAAVCKFADAVSVGAAASPILFCGVLGEPQKGRGKVQEQMVYRETAMNYSADSLQ